MCIRDRYRFRLYPSKKQEKLLTKHFGCCRFIYNFLLSFKEKVYKEEGKSIARQELQAKIAELKKDEQYSWLKEVNSQSLQVESHNLDHGFKRFFKKMGGYPKRKKFHKQSFAIPQNVLLAKGKNKFDFFIVPKFKEGIKIKRHREVEGEIRQATVVRETGNKYYVSILVDKKDFPPDRQTEKEVGVDLGLKDFIVTDDGKKVSSPGFLRSKEKRLQHAQKMLSKKKKGSRNYKKGREKVAVLHQRVKNQRKHFLHEQSREIVRENQAIYFEDLHAAGMIKNHKLAKSIADAGWATFVGYASYKADWYGRRVVFIDRFAPSSQLCSSCGTINSKLQLSERTWCCQVCRVEHDRDINAARNIKKLGQGMSEVKPVERTASTFWSGGADPSRSRAHAGSKKQEPPLTFC